MKVSLVHDYLTQRGGAERVVVAMLRAFPGAPLHTSLYDPARTFPAFGEADVRTLGLDRVPLLRRWHRLALPMLARAFSRLRVEADVVFCSSSGWAHGAHVSGRKVVYCHAPARWLYQPERYLGARPSPGRWALAPLRRRLERWDRAAAQSADRYLVNSRAVQALVRDVYGIEAEVLPPPHGVGAGEARRPVRGLEPGFVLCVSRFLPYKNVDAVAQAFAALSGKRLVVVGTGPDERRLRAAAPPNVRFLGAVADDELRWLYSACSCLVAASYEDFGLTPLEAAAFGRPTAALRWGGFLDTVAECETGVFFDAPEPDAIARAVGDVLAGSWDERAISAHAAAFSEERFVARLREIAAEEARAAAATVGRT